MECGSQNLGAVSEHYYCNEGLLHLCSLGLQSSDFMIPELQKDLSWSKYNTKNVHAFLGSSHSVSQKESVIRNVFENWLFYSTSKSARTCSCKCTSEFPHIDRKSQ